MYQKLLPQFALSFLGLLTFLFLQGCGTRSEEIADVSSSKKYYDVLGFVNSQIDTLSKFNPKAEKSMSVGGEKGVVESENLNWKRELDLFIQSDINKKAYLASYNTLRPNSLSYVYELKEKENLPVRSLEIELDENTRLPKVIKAHFQTNNNIYESEKMIEMECGAVKGLWMVRSYKMNGFQKLPILDRKNFSIQVTLKNS